jgi:NAD(P)-dependent dehydrogenase (short-subunit alcohol dehydrogenase family)
VKAAIRRRLCKGTEPKEKAMRELSGRTAVITGAGSGIGRGLALAMAEAGMHVVAGDVRLAAAEETCHLLQPPRDSRARALAFEVDVSDAQAMQRFATRAEHELGPIHVLCNNAGVCLFGELDALSAADWAWLWGVNVMGVVHGLQSFLPAMRAHGQPGHVVNTASLAGLVGFREAGGYVATKFAVVGMSEVLRAELHGSPIGVSVLCPAAVATEIHQSDRTRPAALGPAGQGTRQVSEAHVRTHGIDPLDVGRCVRKAVIEEDFYVFTHPNIRRHVDARHDAMIEAFERWALERGAGP